MQIILTPQECAAEIISAILLWIAFLCSKTGAVVGSTIWFWIIPIFTIFGGRSCSGSALKMNPFISKSLLLAYSKTESAIPRGLSMIKLIQITYKLHTLNWLTAMVFHTKCVWHVPVLLVEHISQDNVQKKQNCHSFCQFKYQI